MGNRSPRGFAVIAVVVCLALLSAGPATAGDPNHRPPDIELTAAGNEGFINARAKWLAYFDTGLALDPKAEYRRDSKVTFTCRIDGRPVKCNAGFQPVDKVEVEYGRPNKWAQTGFFGGAIQAPDDLAPGPHTITVRARDEDGPEAAPKSVEITFDPTPPSAPTLTEKPLGRSWDHKPDFVYSSSDDMRLVRPEGEGMFIASLRRLKPTYQRYREDSGESSMVSWLPECPDLLTCSIESRVVYWSEEDWYSFAEDEWLLPGLYEFRARA
ncbi:MAG TPA: hypothetical protein VFB52_03940, partial [Solirubrobacterales bacterium]|nr:hypothetical protein [Solirubrobacterales bacterium]